MKPIIFSSFLIDFRLFFGLLKKSRIHRNSRLAGQFCFLKVRLTGQLEILGPRQFYFRNCPPGRTPVLKVSSSIKLCDLACGVDIYEDKWASMYIAEAESFYRQRADGVLVESRDTLGYMRFAFMALEKESQRAEKYLLTRSRAALMKQITIGELYSVSKSSSEKLLCVQFTSFRDF